MKRIVASVFKDWLDFIFPPLCDCCKEPCETTFLCPGCWELCSLPDPAERCRHCFAEKGEEICPACRIKAEFPFPSAFVFESTPPVFHLCIKGKEEPEIAAAFALVQWERLDWPIPDSIVPLPGCRDLAKIFAAWLERPCADVLQCSRGWNCDVDGLEENQLILVICRAATADEIRGAAEALYEAFPKKIFVLSLTPIVRNP